jgi:hypothetical protein
MPTNNNNSGSRMFPNNNNNNRMPPNNNERPLSDHVPEFQSVPQQNFDTEEMRGSMQYILAQNIGEYVVVEFLIGTNRMMRKQGLLFQVGTSFVTLYDDAEENYIVCDIFSIKFVYFYLPGVRPRRNYNILPTTNGSIYDR